MPQAVDRGGSLNARFLDPLAESSLYLAAGEALAVAVGEKGASVAVSKIASQVGRDLLSEDNLFRPITFRSADLDLASVKVNIINIERDRRS